MVKTDATIWFAKVGMTCALLLTCCWAVQQAVKNPPRFPPMTMGEQQMEVFNRYFQLPTLDFVLVGSSLSYRLKEQYFEHGNVRNAALPGGSSLTGLAIIGAAPFLPRVVAVETNILNRDIDNELLQKFKSTKRLDHALRPLRTLAAYYQSALDNELPVNEARGIEARRRSILERPPATYDTKRGTVSALVEWNKPIYSEAILRDAKALKTLVENLEGQGIRIFFYEMPLPPILNQTGYVTMTRDVLAQIFGPANKRWLDLKYDAGELRWNDDGAHLDERSAIIISSALGEAINKKMVTH
jgi:hypothetical protein